MKAFLYRLVYQFAWLHSLLPLRLLYILSDVLFFFIYYIISYRKQVVLTNLKNSFPEKSEKEINWIARKFYHHLSDIIVEIIKLIHFSEKEYKKHIHFRNPEVLDKYFYEGKTVSAVVAHYGNWEWLTGLVCQNPFEVVSVYKPLNNKNFDKLLGRLRTKFGTQLVPMEKVLHTVVNRRQMKKKSLYIFISDQTPIQLSIKYWTTFLNQDTPVFLGIEKIARKEGHAVVFLSMNKLKRGYYEVEIHPLVDNALTTDPYEITEMHVRKLEELINKHPEYWLWSHRRWKRKRNNVILEPFKKGVTS